MLTHPWTWSNENINYVLGEAMDDQAYEKAAKSMLAGKALTPEWGPGYPAFIALIYRLFGEKAWVLFVVQSLLDLITVSAVYLISWEIFKSEFVSAVATLVYSSDLATMFYLQTMESESLFNLFFTVSVLFLIKALSTNGKKNAAVSGLFLGVSTLIRPIALLYPSVAIIPFFVGVTRGNKAEASRVFLTFLSVFILVLTPWCVRNYVHYGSFSLSSTPGYHLCLWIASSVKAHEDGISRHDVAKSLCYLKSANMTQLSQSKKMGDIAVAYLMGHPRQWGILHLQGLYGFFTSSPVASIILRQSFIQPELLLKMHSLIEAINPAYFAFQSMIYILSLLGIYHGMKDRHLRAPILLFALTILYFANLSSQGADMDYSRFRIPAYSSMAVLSAYGLSKIIPKRILGRWERAPQSSLEPFR
jgi:4-amino-4-deoxy-L-arabinose transferase-like glycosyltransferase